MVITIVAVIGKIGEVVSTLVTVISTVDPTVSTISNGAVVKYILAKLVARLLQCVAQLLMWLAR